jgi:hypothetical protein
MWVRKTNFIDASWFNSRLFHTALVYLVGYLMRDSAPNLDAVHFELFGTSDAMVERTGVWKTFMEITLKPDTVKFTLSLDDYYFIVVALFCCDDSVIKSGLLVVEQIFFA